MSARCPRFRHEDVTNPNDPSVVCFLRYPLPTVPTASPSPGPAGPLPGWRSGKPIWSTPGTKFIILSGLGSRTGDGERNFWALSRYLAREGGYDAAKDVVEASYAGSLHAGAWTPRPYTAPDTRRPLAETAEAVANTLDWYRDAFPPAATFCVMGYSLGGVAVLDGATLAVARDRAGWRGRLRAVIPLASPVRGCNAGPLMQWAWLVTHDPDPLGQAGVDLERRWSDPAEQERVLRRAAFLRASGATVLTLADPDDAVVRPDEALLPAPGEDPQTLLVPTQNVRQGAMGHGSILDEPRTWRRILQVVGPRSRVVPASDANGVPGAGQPAPPPRAPAPTIEDELQAIKERLRAAGRLRRSSGPASA